MLNSFVNNGTYKRVCESLVKSEQTYEPDAFEKNRVIKLSGHPATLDKIERMLAYMSMLGRIGHSTSFTVDVDGDGGFSCLCKDENNKALNEKHSNWIDSKVDENYDIKSFSFE